MAIKPIIFNTEMVRAILTGTKTQTRRIVKGIEGLNVYRAEPSEDAYESLAQWDFFYGWSDENGMYDAIESVKAPYAVGDVLWVREAWDNIPVSTGGHLRIGGKYYYKADPEQRPKGWRGAWKPAIYMPKEAAQIFLKVKDVRVGRLQDMAESDAIVEEFPDFPTGTDSPLARF